MAKFIRRSIILSSLFTLLISFQAYSELKNYGDFEYDIENYADGWEEEPRLGACIYHYTATSSDAILIFPDEIEGYPVLEIGSGTIETSGFFVNSNVRDSISEVIIPESVEILGSAFRWAGSLEAVYFEGNNLKRLGPSSFSGCKNLKEIELPEGVRDIRGSAFKGCDSLETLTIPSSVRYFGTNHPGDADQLVASGEKLSQIVNLSEANFPIVSIQNSHYDWYLDENGRQKAKNIPANSTLYAIKRNKKPVSDSDSSDSGDDNEVIPKKYLSLEELKKTPGLHTIELPARDGKWEVKDGRWKFKRSDGQYAKAQWVYDSQKWYIIGADGQMLTGWQQINGKWYYFNELGIMQANTTTPDGYRVNSDGVWIEEIK